MRHNSLLAGFAATALIASLAWIAPAAAAPPKPSDVGETLINTVLVKVDGDNVSDTVQIFRDPAMFPADYRIQVTTNTGKTSSVRYFTALSADDYSPWYGAANIDGVAGKELVFRSEMPNELEPVSLTVFTWRKGRLIAEAAPAPFRSGWEIDDRSARVSGLRFFTWHKRPYVEVSSLLESNSGKSWSGTITRSVWKNLKWTKVSARKVKLSTKAANRYLGFNGVPLLLGNLRADIDGDARDDRVDLFRYSEYSNGHFLGHYGAKVMTAKGKTVTKKFHTSLDKIYGAGSLDGVAGKELAFESANDNYSWQVFTWRSGKLVSEPAPPMCDRAKRVWEGCSDEAPTGVTFTAVNGLHYALAAQANREDAVVTLWNSVWRNKAWVTVSTTTRTLTEADTPLLSGLDSPDWVALNQGS